MTTDPAGSFELKLDRAQEHLETLNRELDDFLKRDPQPIIRKVEGERIEYVAEVREPFPPRLALIAGDVLQNARSALDHLAWRLAGDKAHIDSGFPIYNTERLYNAAVPRKLKGVGNEARALIEGLQPYKGTDYGKALGALNELARIDRHRDLHLVGGVSEETKVTIGNSGADGRPRFIEIPKGDVDYVINFGTFEHGTVLAFFVCPPDMDVDCEFACYVAMTDSSPDSPYYPMLLSLDGIVRAIRLEVFPRLIPHVKPFAPTAWAGHEKTLEQRIDLRVEGQSVEIRTDKPLPPSKG